MGWGVAGQAGRTVYFIEVPAQGAGASGSSTWTVIASGV